MKTYSLKHNAKRAALAALGEMAVEGIHFHLVDATTHATKAGAREWTWTVEVTAEVKQKAPEKPQERRKAPAATTGPTTKGAAVLALLQRRDGATNAEIQLQTGWQPHTVRGFFAGKQMARTGFKAERFQRSDGVSAYRAVKAGD